MSAYQEPFFARGPSPLAKLTFFSLIAIAVMIADHRFQALSVVRIGVSAVLSPIEQVLAMPGAWVSGIGRYFSEQHRLINENEVLSKRVVELSAAGQQANLLLAEKPFIEALSAAQARFGADGVIAEIIRDARNPFERKLIVNKGMKHGVTAGSAVIDGVGVVGQVTAVGLLSAEVTLSTEKDQSVPVVVVRNGLRAIALGAGREGTIDLPFLPVGADVVTGDKLVTSGIDGTYPAGLAVGDVTTVEKNPAFPFARIAVKPVTSTDHNRLVKVLIRPENHAYPKSDIQKPEKKTGRERNNAEVGKDAAKEPSKDAPKEPAKEAAKEVPQGAAKPGAPRGN
jgi:rod shape-determining protein MreC